MKTCCVCGRSIAGRRANAVTCGPACRKARSRERNRALFPEVMTSVPRWVSWKPVRRGARWTKVPVTVAGRYASSTNPATWSTWSAVKGLERRGFVLGNGVGCIDLDDCLHDGVLSPVAARIVADHVGHCLFIEVSPSGRGVHIFKLMEQGPGRVRNVCGQRVEVYPPNSGRYICVTGKRL